MSKRTDIDQPSQAPCKTTAMPTRDGTVPGFLRDVEVDERGGEGDTHAGAAGSISTVPLSADVGTLAPAPVEPLAPRDAADASDGTADLAAGAEHAADAARSLITEGMAGVREARAAKRAHADAREHLELLERTIAEREEELAHRRDVAENFAAIIAEQKGRRAAAATAKAEAERASADHTAQATALKEELDRMREADSATEKRLKSALDAAEAKEASARESGSRLQRRVDDAERNLARAEQERTEGVAVARRAIASAQEHLETLKAEYAEIQRNPSANPAGYTVRSGELSGQIADATEAVRLATDELPRIDAETAAPIDAARAALAEAKRPIAAAKQAFEEVREQADRARDAHAEAREQAEERQKELRRRISEQEKSAREQDKAAEKAIAEDEAAQAVIEEARDIQAHPEVTEALAGALAADREERDQQQGEVERLAATERDVRERTRAARMRLIGAAAAVALVLACIVVLVITMQ